LNDLLGTKILIGRIPDAKQVLSALRSAARAAPTILVIAAGIVLCCEALYRVFLYYNLHAQIEQKYKLAPLERFNAYGAEPWIFDRAFGFNFNQKPWLVANIKNDAFDGCGVAGRGNRFGNYGAPDDQYEKADLKVIIVGSSYTMVPDRQGALVNEVLDRQLSDHLKRRVDVLNFSRDATGVLSYADAAREVVKTLRPDVVLMLINTPGLIYRRLWRSVMPDESGNLRFYQMLSADAKPTDEKLAFPQVQVINHNITEQWCSTMDAAAANGDNSALHTDPLVQALVAENLRQRRQSTIPKIAVNFWRLDVSFVRNLLAKGNPFDKMTTLFETPSYSPYDREHYSDDPEFVAAIAELRQSGIPVIPVHIPAYKEMAAYPDGGFEFGVHGVPPAQGKSLVDDLQQQLGQSMVELYRFYPAALKEHPVKLVFSEDNSHPSPFGVQAMADALATMLRTDPRTAPMFQPAPAADGAPAAR
jgi:hypothetical protein